MSCQCDKKIGLMPESANGSFPASPAFVPITSPAVLSRNGTQAIRSWNDFAMAYPADIRNLIAYANIGATVGTLVNSETFAVPLTSWTANTAYISGTPVCYANGTDDEQKVAEAKQWNMLHPTYCPYTEGRTNPLMNTIFLRGGRQWRMNVPIALPTTGDPIVNIQIGFLDNAATRGDAQGTMPVVQFAGSFTGMISLSLTLHEAFGRYDIAIRFIDLSDKYVFFDTRWWVVR